MLQSECPIPCKKEKNTCYIISFEPSGSVNILVMAVEFPYNITEVDAAWSTRLDHLIGEGGLRYDHEIKELGLKLPKSYNALAQRFAQCYFAEK